MQEFKSPDTQPKTWWMENTAASVHYDRSEAVGWQFHCLGGIDELILCESSALSSKLSSMENMSTGQTIALSLA